jgi:hypothetical protein
MCKERKAMKNGRTLNDLAKEIDRQLKTKKDFSADTRRLAISNDGTRLSIAEKGTFGITDLCHDQIAARVGIPVKYYQKMRSEYPSLVGVNVNAWFNSKAETRMVRTLDGNARAFVSDRYRPLDNYDLINRVLPKIKEVGCRIESAELTEKRLYIKAITDRITAKVVGDVVQAGIVISNSEVGCGSVKVEPLIFTLSCLNGAIMPDYSMRKYHVGRGFGDIENDGQEFFKDETRRADDKAFWLKVRDTVDASLDEVKFNLMVGKLRKAAEKTIDGDPIKAVEEITKKFVMSEDEQGSVLNFLIKGGNLSCYGLSNAVTRASQEISDYDRATEFERIGGSIIELSDAEWKQIGKN